MPYQTHTTDQLSGNRVTVQNPTPHNSSNDISTSTGAGHSTVKRRSTGYLMSAVLITENHNPLTGLLFPVARQDLGNSHEDVDGV